jgi:hypothetical protein
MKVQLVIFIIMLLMGGIQAMYRAYQKKKVQLEAERFERERRDTILRTGRDPLAEQAAAMQRDAQREEAALMAQRQEALRQLRAQQEAANQGGQRGINPPALPQSPAPTSGGGPITRELWPGGPVIVINGPAPSPQQQQQRPAPNQLPQQRPQQQQRQQELRRAQPVQPPPRAQPVMRNKKQQQQQRPQRQQPPQSLQQREDARHDDAYYQRERALARMQAGNAPTPQAVAAEPVFVRPTTAQQWRNAVIAAEILGTPVSMRDAKGAPGGPML